MVEDRLLINPDDMPSETKASLHLAVVRTLRRLAQDGLLFGAGQIPCDLLTLFRDLLCQAFMCITLTANRA